jgi:hypothetical protein
MRVSDDKAVSFSACPPALIATAVSMNNREDKAECAEAAARKTSNTRLLTL